MKTKRWLGVLLAAVMVFSLTIPVAALQIPKTEDQMYAAAHTEGAVVPVNVDPYTAFHPERLDPTNVYCAFDAVQMPGGTAELNANDYFYGLASRTWTAYTFVEPFCNVDTVPDIEFSEVTWGNWHAEGARVYLLDAQIINGDGDIVLYSGDDYTDDGFGNSYYAGIIGNKIAIAGIDESVKNIIRNSYLPDGVTRTFHANTFAIDRNFGITQFYLPDEVVSARAILLVDITADTVPVDALETPAALPFYQLVNGSIASLPGVSGVPSTFSDVSGTGALLTFQSREQGATQEITDDIIKATVSSGSNGNSDGYDLDAIRVYDYDPPLEDISGYKINSDTVLPIAGVTIILERLNSADGWDSVKSTTTDSDGKYCFPNLEPGTYRVSEVLEDGWEQVFPGGDGSHVVTLPADLNLIENGDFEQGEEGFTSEYTHVVATGTQALWGEGSYAIGTDPYQYHYLWQSFADHTTGDENNLMMIVNGEEFAAGKTVWSSSANVTADTDYTFSFWGATSYPAAYSNLSIYINGEQIDEYHAPSYLAEWTKYSVVWNSGDADTADIKLVCDTLEHTGNDFALDDFCLTADDLDFINRINTGDVPAFKFYDANANGAQDSGESGIPGWKIEILNGAGGVVDTKYTNASGEVLFTVPHGDYTIREVMPNEASWMATTPTEQSVTVERLQTAERVEFGNVCIGAGGGHTLGFWSNKNGQAMIDADDLAMLTALSLVDQDGNAFDPASKIVLRTWLLGGNATNMSYMLSVQLAAMELNVANGFVNSEALIYVPYLDDFMTVSAVMGAADAALGSNGLTTESGTDRDYQEGLKNALDDANNNLNFVQANPGQFTF